MSLVAPGRNLRGYESLRRSSRSKGGVKNEAIKERQRATGLDYRCHDRVAGVWFLLIACLQGVVRMDVMTREQGIARRDELLKELGYTYYCIYKNRKPEFLSLI